MSSGGQETEAKFHVRDRARIKSRAEELGARLTQERVLETNLRFDLPGAPLQAGGRVLRLRQDTQARLTYKGAGKKEEGVSSREEIEFLVEDFEKAKQFLEALGYQRMFCYEKYRTTYELDQTWVMLDELPYGDFVEIEGENAQAIRAVADRLRLDWEAAIAASYHALFERVRRVRRLDLEDLSFAAFEGLTIEPGDLGVEPADRSPSRNRY